jgi:ATP-binding cassette subfamily C (CFTR/MRP) protein 1
MVSFLSLAAFITTQHTAFRPKIVFPALTLLQLLHNPLASFPYTVSAVFDAAEAIKRISKFELESEIQPGTIDRLPFEEVCESSVTVEEGAFTWGEATEPCISIPHLIVNRKDLCCVVGCVGSGKSTLLQGLLGSLFKAQGSAKIRSSMAYVAQVPWIINGSIKENILFGHEMDPEFYDMVLEACALKDDLLTLTDRDDTQVGGQGMNLSGGQKARLALARAVYARTDVYLLDDVLSAVDMHVRRHLMLRVLGPQGMLRGTTRILATSTLSILKDSDLIVMLEKGKAVQIGNFEQIRTGQGPVATFLQAHVRESDEDHNQTNPPITAKEGPVPLSVVLSAFQTAKLAGKQQRTSKTYLSGKQQSKNTSGQTSTIQRQENNNWKLYKTYARASGSSSIISCLLALLAHRLSVAGTDIWIKIWTESYDGDDGGAYKNWTYIGIYFALGLGSAVGAGVQMYFLLVHCSLLVEYRSIHVRERNLTVLGIQEVE